MSEMLVRMEQCGRTYSRGKTSVAAVVSATCIVMSGDRVAVVGPSGSGKSTLLHLLGGLDMPTTGSVCWPALGARKDLRPTKVGLVFQVPSLLAPLTVVENVEIPLLLAQDNAHHVGPDSSRPSPIDRPRTARNINADKARAAALDALDRIGLRSIAEKLPEELSGGQAQRVAVARALASQPKLILADEPTGQLDHPTAKHLFDVLLASLEGTEIALVVATHDRTVAERMNTVWHMQHGILEVNV